MDKPKTTPRDFFIHLGIIITLYISAISLINLFFNAINAVYPDKLEYYVDPYSGSLRWAIASLIIIFPLFLLLSWLSARDIRRDQTRADIAVRKWLTYLTLFLAGIAIVTDLVVLINTFLGGEITTRFVLKVISILVVTGIIFYYYITDLRKGSAAGSYKKTWGIVGAVIVLASVVAGFAVIGSPATARKMKFDDRRVSDIQNIRSNIFNYWQMKGSLPKSLDELSNLNYYSKAPVDPETNAPYEYQPSGPTLFSLCAVFDRSNKSDPYQGRSYPEFQVHGEGRTCFPYSIDPALYPTKPVPRPV